MVMAAANEGAPVGERLVESTVKGMLPPGLSGLGAARDVAVQAGGAGSPACGAAAASSTARRRGRRFSLH
jgi:hypothetical protein